MAKNEWVHAPYNFIPFSDRLLIRYDTPEQLPPHNVLDDQLKSGEIHITMKAETPVFLSNGEKEGKAGFFRGANGKMMIPGSALRGMVRQNMQILSYGWVAPHEDVEDVTLYFREVASAKGSTAGSLKAYYHNALGTKTFKNQDGTEYSVPMLVKSGYLRCDGKTYTIVPTKTPYMRISRKHPDIATMANETACVKSVRYQTMGDRVTQILPLGDGAVRGEIGEVLFTGRFVKDPNARYLFPQPDESQDAIELTEEEIISYQADFEYRKNSLKAYHDVNFWALPESGQQKPVFYIEHEGHTYFGMSQYLRIGYRHSIAEGLQSRHQEWSKKQKIPLDYVRSMLGFTSENDAYASRVSFGDCQVRGNPREMHPIRRVLGEPRPSYYPGYVVNGANYNSDEFLLRGHKLYWHHEPDLKTPYIGKDTVGTTLRPLPVGTEFTGVIRFRNLHEDELGLLLWSLQLEEDCYQSIGQGKPYGFGRMTLKIDQLLEDAPSQRYEFGLLGQGMKNVTDEISKYIRHYDNYAACIKVKKPKKTATVSSRDELKDFFFMKRTIRKGEEVSYMELGEFKNNVATLELVSAIRKYEQDQQEQAKQQNSMSYEDLKKSWANKLNSKVEANSRRK